MRFLLDENMNQRTAVAMTALASGDGDEYRHLTEFATPGAQDLEIPSLCQVEGFDCLITVNHRDFAAQKVIYQALLASQIHVVALRFGRSPPTPDRQVSYLAQHRSAIRGPLMAALDQPKLLVVTQSAVRPRDLEELEREILTDARRVMP